MSDNNINIRLAKTSDAPELARLNDLFNGQGSNSPDSVEESLKTNENEIVCVADVGAVDESKLIGYCCGQIVRSMSRSYNSGDITDLFVIEEYRGYGVGRRLLARIENEFQKRGVSHLHISTGKENRAAQTLYRSCGYKETTEFILDKDLPTVE